MFKNICFLHFSWFPTNCWRLRAKARNFCEAVSWTASSSFSGLSSCYSERLRNYPEDRKSRNQIGTEPFCPFLGFCRESHHWKLCAWMDAAHTRTQTYPVSCEPRFVCIPILMKQPRGPCTLSPFVSLLPPSLYSFQYDWKAPPTTAVVENYY